MKKFSIQILLLAFLLGPLCAASTTGPATGTIWPNLSYKEEELFKTIGRINADNGGPSGHSLLSAHKGYLVVIGSVDGGSGDGHMSFFDLANPREPKLINHVYNEHTKRLREAHGYGYSNSYPGDYVVLQTRTGLQFWDWTDVSKPEMLSDFDIPPMTGGDYSGTPWWTFWQAPYVYVGGMNTGIHIVDATNPRAPKIIGKPISISQTGGFKIGSLYAIGNLLVGSNIDGPGIATFDISDPKRPALLCRTDSKQGYSTFVNGHHVYSFGSGTPKEKGVDPNRDLTLHVYDIHDPSKIEFLTSCPTPIKSKGGYGMVHEGRVFGGFSKYTAVFDITTDPAKAPLVWSGEPTGVKPGSDLDFSTAIGNLIMASSDHGDGTYMLPHQLGPDIRGPEVTMIIPRDAALSQAVTSRVGVTMSEMIDLRSVTSETFIVRPKGGRALAGKYSHQVSIVNFFPDKPLQENVTYEVVINGIKDVVGNSMSKPFNATFSTGAILSPIEIEVSSVSATPRGKAVSYDVAAAKGEGLQFSWDFGDGSPTTEFAATAKISHTFEKPGHYSVLLKVKSAQGQTSRSFIQTIFNPPTERQPSSSGTIVFDSPRNRVWCVNTDSDTVTALSGGKAGTAPAKAFEVPVGKNPRTLALAPDGALWVANQDDATISVLNGNDGSALSKIELPFASRPYGITFSPDGAAAFVTLQGTGKLLKIGARSQKIEGVADVGPKPRGIAISEDSARVLVTRFVSPRDYGEVIEVDPATMKVTRTIQLALDTAQDKEDSGRGVPNYLSSITISPDGKRAWVPSKKDNTVRGLARDGQPLNFESTVRTIVCVIDLEKNAEVMDMRRDFNDRDMAFAVRFSKRGDYAFVTTQGTNTVEILDAYTNRPINAIMEVGRSPQGLAFDDSNALLYIQNFMSRTISVYDLSSTLESTAQTARPIAEISTVEKEKLAAQVLQGKQIFYNANDNRMNHDGYISCASCHLDGDSDARVWDFTDRGEGLRNTTSLLGRRGMGHGPVHWTANFDEIQDFEHDMRGPFGGMGFMPAPAFNTGTRNTTLGMPKAGYSPELDALAAYVTSLNVIHPSPYRNADGSLTADAKAGKEIFKKANCAACHSGADFTDSAKLLLHDVGTISKTSGQRMYDNLMGLDTPTLRGVWETAPYLHDGSAPTLLDVLTTASLKGLHGDLSKITDAEKIQLAAYLQQIDNVEEAAPDSAVSVAIKAGELPVWMTGKEISLPVETGPDVSRVEFLLGGQKVYEASAKPFTFKWTATAICGEFGLVARAFSANGSSTVTAPISVVVAPRFGLSAVYYSINKVRKSELARIDANLDMTFLKSPVPELEAKPFNAIWQGRVQPLNSEEYVFTVDTDGLGYVRVIIDGQKIIETPKKKDAKPDPKAVVKKAEPLKSKPVALRKGALHDIRVEYLGSMGKGGLKLLWSSKIQEQEVIPTERFFPAISKAAQVQMAREIETEQKNRQSEQENKD